MSWINDAKSQAEIVKQETASAKLHAEEIQRKEKLEEALKREQPRILFHQTCDTTIQAINRVLEEARRQGLVVTSGVDVDNFNIPGNLYGHHSEYIDDDTKGTDGSNGYYRHSRIGFAWEILEPSTGQSGWILLGVSITEGQSWWNKGRKIYKPTTSAHQVEAEIKNWLVEIFSQ